MNEYIAQGRTFLSEVGAELRKVYWPPRPQTMAFTGVVLFVVSFVAIYLGVVDYVLSLLPFDQHQSDAATQAGLVVSH